MVRIKKVGLDNGYGFRMGVEKERVGVPSMGCGRRLSEEFSSLSIALIKAPDFKRGC